MQSKPAALLALLTLSLAGGLTACDNGGDDIPGIDVPDNGGVPGQTVKDVTLENIAEKLSALPVNDPDNPHTLVFAAGVCLTKTDGHTDWTRVNEAVCPSYYGAGDDRVTKFFVILDLAACRAEDDEITGVGALGVRDPAKLYGECVAGIVLPETLKKIGAYAFYGASLKSLAIPAGVTEIGEGAFDDSTGLKSVILGEDAFSGGGGVSSGGGLSSLTIPAGLCGSFNAKFAGYTSLAVVLTGSGAIPAHAFVLCTGLKSVTIGDGVTGIGGWAFYGCPGLASVTIPEGVTTIGEDAFNGCTGLPGVTLPDSVTTIGSAAFFGCTGLKNVTIPEGVTTIGGYAFFGCTGLKSVTFAGSDTAITDGTYRAFPNEESLLTAGGASADNGYTMAAGTYRLSGTVWGKQA